MERKKIERKRNRAKDSEESNFSGRPRRMGSIGKVGLLIKRRQRLERRRPGVHRHRRPGADVGTLGRKRKTFARQNVERLPTPLGRCIPGTSYLGCVVGGRSGIKRMRKKITYRFYLLKRFVFKGFLLLYILYYNFYLCIFLLVLFLFPFPPSLKLERLLKKIRRMMN